MTTLRSLKPKTSTHTPTIKEKADRGVCEVERENGSEQRGRRFAYVGVRHHGVRGNATWMWKGHATEMEEEVKASPSPTQSPDTTCEIVAHQDGASTGALHGVLWINYGVRPSCSLSVCSPEVSPWLRVGRDIWRLQDTVPLIDTRNRHRHKVV